MCAECADKVRKYQEESRVWAKERKLCPRCLKNRLMGEERTCPECLAIASIYNKKSREKHYGTSHDYYVMDIARIKAQGLCRSCRKQKVAEGHTYCPTCLIKHRNRKRKDHQYDFNDFIPRSERRGYNLCYRCGNPLDSDKNLCTACCESVVKNFKGIRGNNTYWKQGNQLIFGGVADGR